VAQLFLVLFLMAEVIQVLVADLVVTQAAVGLEVVELVVILVQAVLPYFVLVQLEMGLAVAEVLAAT
jgi:hypothetical protein